MRAIFLEGLVENKGQGAGEAVENKVFMVKHRLDVVRFAAEIISALRNAVGEGRKNAVSHAVLRLQFRGCQISVNQILALFAIGRERSPAEKRCALISDLGAKTVAGNGQTGNPRACCGSGHRELSFTCMHLRRPGRLPRRFARSSSLQRHFAMAMMRRTHPWRSR